MFKQLLPILGALAVLAAPIASLGNENVGEKINKEGNTASRKMKRSSHRAKEKACKDGTASCAGKKVKNRAKEGADYVGDKAEEVKDKAD